MIIISQCFYGCCSPFVKNILDRSVSCLLPYFKTKNGETYHPKRYDNAISLVVHFYGEISDTEKETAKKFVKANGKGMFEETEIHFYNTVDEIKGII